MRISGVRDALNGRKAAGIAPRDKAHRLARSCEFRSDFSDIFASCEKSGGRISRAG
jgi:hypothetical protein